MSARGSTWDQTHRGRPLTETLQHRIGPFNKRSGADSTNPVTHASVPSRFAYDFSRVPTMSAEPIVQTKLEAHISGDQ